MFEHRNMEGKVHLANLAILDPMEKMDCRFRMRIERYGQVAPTVKIKDLMGKI